MEPSTAPISRSEHRSLRVSDAPPTRNVSAATASAIDTYAVRVIRGHDEALEARVGAEPVAIGTSPTNRMVLCDPVVSRFHCEVNATANGLHVRDLGSTNGTFVDGVRIDAAYLRPGSRITIGATTLAVEVTAEKLIESLPANSR